MIERVRDELGDWRICVLSPRGGRIHAPWAMAVAAKIREETGTDVETLWSDDGFVVRFPDVDEPPDPRLLLPDPDEVQALVVRQICATGLFAAIFRENAAGSLLLPKRRPGTRAPLWQQRKRASDLLAVASRYGSFPVLLETYRECLRDFFDMPSLIATLGGGIRSRRICVATVNSEIPSPFAGSLLFGYVANFLYDGDAPLAERRAQALAVDQSQLRELLGDAELRELLDAESMDAGGTAAPAPGPAVSCQARGRPARHAAVARRPERARYPRARGGPRRRRSLAAPDHRRAPRAADPDRRPSRVSSRSKTPRATATASACRCPSGFPSRSSSRSAIRSATSCCVTRAPTRRCTALDFAGRYGLGTAAAEGVLMRLALEGRLVEGEFRPGGTRREWTDAGVLRMLRRKSLAKLRHEIEPVDQAVLGRFTTTWQGIVKRRHGADALLDAVEQLQGAPLPASILETEILPARIDGYDPADLDAVTAAGEVVWVGVEPLGERDGRVALYLADHLERLLPPRVQPKLHTDGKGRPSCTPDGYAHGTRTTSARELAILEALRVNGASFFGPLHEAVGAGYPAETVDALWNLVWLGLVTNDTFSMRSAPLRTLGHHAERRRLAGRPSPQDRSTGLSPRPRPKGAGRWSRRKPARRAPRSGRRRSRSSCSPATAC